MPPKRKPVRKTTTSKTPVRKKPAVKRATVTQTIAKKPVVDKSFVTTIAKLRKDLAGTHVFVLSIPWEAKGIATVFGAKWNPDLRQFLYEGLTLPTGLIPYASEDYSLERWVEDELNGSVKTPTGITGTMKPRPHQVKAIKKIEASAKAGWRGFILADNVGVGKGLIGSTEIPTPDGFTTIGELGVGDYVISSDGTPTKVIEKYLSKATRFYRITFSDGTEVYADEDHRWLTTSAIEAVRERTQSKPIRRISEQEEIEITKFLLHCQSKKLGVSFYDCNQHVSKPTVLRALLKSLKPVGKLGKAFIYHPQEILEKLPSYIYAGNKWGGQFDYEKIKNTNELFLTQHTTIGGNTKASNHAVKNTLPVEYSAKELPIDPYVFGVWLGDGSSHSGSITSMDPDISALIEKHYLLNRFETQAHTEAKTYFFKNLRNDLKKLLPASPNKKGKLVKVIPDSYLYSSITQRLELLKGLMDTDGSIGLSDKRSTVSFSQKEEKLFFQVYQIICSLGWKATWRYRKTNWTYKGVKKESYSYELRFSPSQQVFKCARKAEILEKRLTDIASSHRIRHSMRHIAKIEEVKKTENYYCISVDAPSHMFLCTKSYIPTHNTISAIFGAYATANHKGFTPKNKAATLIIAPKSVLPHWRNTIKATGVNNMRIVVINYDQAKKLLDVPASATTAKTKRTANKRTANSGTPTIKWDIIIADESHKLKNVSQRTAAFNKVARYSASTQTAPFVIWASATVGQNPLEVGYLAPLVSQLSGGKAISTKEWGDWLIANHFNVTKSTGGSYSWITLKKEHSSDQKKELQRLQTKDVTRLSEILFGPSAPSIRRNPEDIAGWPSQTHIPTPMHLIEAEKRLYEEAWRSFRSFMQMNPRGKNPMGGLAAQLRFRQKASLISAPYTAEFANDLLDNGQQIGISVEFIESLDYIKDYLEKKGWHVAEFSGRNTDDRENERLRFQRGEAKVILFTVQEGISLHAGEQLPDGSNATKTKRALLIHDIRYSSIAMSQILGRMTRDGELANAYYMYTEDTVESQILEVMLRRMKNLRALSGDDDDIIEVIENLLDGVSTP